MKRTVSIFVGTHPQLVGRVHHESDGRRESTAFEYDASWLASPDGFAIDPALPLVVGPQFRKKPKEGSAFAAAISDTEPDGWARRVILRDHAKRRKETRERGEAEPPPVLDDLDFLLAVDDESRVGALRFEHQGVFARASEPGIRTAPPLVELSLLLAASRAVETHSETSADLAYLRGRGTSLGGLRPKCTVVDDEGRLSIGKFPSVDDDRPVTKGEVLAMQLAKRAGLDVADSRIIDNDGVAVALVRRFDRDTTGRRISYVSAATLLQVEPGSGAEHTYTEIVDAIRVHGADAPTDIEELFRRIAFSIAINNVDDHLHNHGFLHVEKGKWRLSPAFDLNPFPDRRRELKTWISEEAGPGASIEALLSVVPYFRIKLARARVVIDEVERAVAGWRLLGRELEMTDAELDLFADAFEHAERRRNSAP